MHLKRTVANWVPGEYKRSRDRHKLRWSYGLERFEQNWIGKAKDRACDSTMHGEGLLFNKVPGMKTGYRSDEHENKAVMM